MLGDLETRHVLGDVRFHIGRCQRVGRRGSHHRGHRLTEARIRNAEHGDFADLRVFVDDGLHFLTSDVLTAANHHVLGAVGDIEKAFLVQMADVAGVHPTIGERGGVASGFSSIR